MKIRFYLHTKHLQVRRWKIFYIVTMAFVVFTIISAKLLVGEKASEEQLRMAFSMIQYESAILSVLFFATDFFVYFHLRGRKAALYIESVCSSDGIYFLLCGTSCFVCQCGLLCSRQTMSMQIAYVFFCWKP